MALPSAQQPAPRQEGDGFRFRTGVELINVAVSVSDANGRYISGLRQDDFVLYEDGVEQPITHFSNERVPVSLGLVVDTSGSMAGEKWDHARSALDRFLLELLGRGRRGVPLSVQQPIPYLLEDWTTDRPRLSRAMRRIVPRGGTAMYDTLAEAVPLADSGQNRKKAIVVISDGNDTQQLDGGAGSQAAHSGDRGAGLCGRHRRRQRLDLGWRVSDGRRCGCPFRSRFQAGGAPIRVSRRGAAAARAAMPGQQRSRERRARCAS